MLFRVEHILCQFVVLMDLIQQSVDAGCDMPRGMKGRWFMQGVGELLVGTSNISNKGYCVQADTERNLYLFENRRMDCYQCLNIILRHRNIIQYRESYCVQSDTFQAICDLLRPEDIWHTMAKVQGMPEDCPFKDAFHFTYNNNTGGFCTYPTSYAKSCASASKFRFHFKHCADAAYTHDEDWDLECYATWQQGDLAFMYGSFSLGGISPSKDMFRCFVYQVLGTVVYMAMSGDSTCRGLRSSRDGSLVLELTKDVFGWPQPACGFPAWISRYSWRDLSGRNTYLTNTEGSVISVRYKYANNLRLVRTAYRCLHIAEERESPSRFLAMSFTSADCYAKYQCVMFVKRRDGVVEINTGAEKEYDTDQCSMADLDNSTRHLLIPAPATVTSCPFPGLHRMINDRQPQCEGYIQSGCNGTSTMEVFAPCSSQTRVYLECLKIWGGKRKSFIIASRSGNSSGVANCFSLKKKAKFWQFATDKTCNIGTTDIFNIAIKYSVNQNAERCIVEKTKPDSPLSDSRQSERDTGDHPEEIDMHEEMQKTQQLDSRSSSSDANGDGAGNGKDGGGGGRSYEQTSPETKRSPIQHRTSAAVALLHRPRGGAPLPAATAAPAGNAQNSDPLLRLFTTMLQFGYSSARTVLCLCTAKWILL